MTKKQYVQPQTVTVEAEMSQMLCASAPIMQDGDGLSVTLGGDEGSWDGYIN